MWTASLLFNQINTWNRCGSNFDDTYHAAIFLFSDVRKRWIPGRENITAYYQSKIQTSGNPGIQNKEPVWTFD